MNPTFRTVVIWAALAAMIFVATVASRGGVDSTFLGPLAVVMLALFVLAAIVVAIRRRQGGGAQQIAQMRQTRARMLAPGAEKTRFHDVGGLAPAKDALGDVVDWLKDPKRWAAAGVSPPRGVLLEGPPGSGKTLLARAVAGESGAKFFVSNATEFVELYVGVGPARVRDLFETAAKAGPCVVFIDEIDAIGRRRGSGVGIVHEEREQALNELLVQLDGFERRGPVVVIAATNRADVLDSALLRPGRFDLRVRVGDLDQSEREAVLKVHVRGRSVATGVDLAALAGQLEGASGATLEAVVNRAALLGMRRARRGGAGALDQADLLAAAAGLRSEDGAFSALDRLLVESAGQLAEPSTALWVEVELAGGARATGRIAWATPELLKIVPADGVPRLLARRELREVRQSLPPEAS